MGASEVSDGRWAFDFNIRVEHNSQCGALTASIDMIKDSQNYFANVAVDGDQIIDAFNCQCEKVFTVTLTTMAPPAKSTVRLTSATANRTSSRLWTPAPSR